MTGSTGDTITEEAVDAALTAGDAWILRTRSVAFVSPARDQVRAMLEATVTAERARLLELENAITWGTSCLSCSRILDRSIADHERAERAEAKLAAIEEHRNAACAALRIAEMGARLQGGDEATAERYRAAREALEGGEGDGHD